MIDARRQCRARLRAVGARIAIGAAWGALPAAGAVTAVADGNVNLAAAMSVLVVLAALVIPLAPFVPVLHRLPWAGSPVLDVALRLNGRRDLVLTVEPEKEYACVLEAEITNPSRWMSVKDAWVKLLIPSGIKVERCDRFGRPEEGGQWEDFSCAALGNHSRADEWRDAAWTLPARLAKHVRIRLRLGASDEDLEFPIRFELAAPTIYDVVKVDGTINVRRGESTLGDRIGRVIASGETILPELEIPAPFLGGQADQQRRNFMAFVAEATEVLNLALSDNPIPTTPTDIAASSYGERAQMYLRALYVARDELGRVAG